MRLPPESHRYYRLSYLKDASFMKLYTKITIGLVAGIVLGWVLNIAFNETPFQEADLDKNNALSVFEVLNSGENLAEFHDDSLFSRADQDGDHRLSPDEIALDQRLQYLSKLEADFVAAEKTGDAQVNPNEILHHGGLLTQYKGGTFAAADTNKNGALDKGEILWHQDVLLHIEQQAFLETDKNGDRLLDTLEMLDGGIAWAPFLSPGSLRKIDIDGNGSLSFPEMQLKDINPILYLSKKFSKVDQDGDSKLRVAEVRSASGIGQVTKYTNPIGKIFIRLVKMVVVPLILASLILGSANMGDIKKLGSIGLKGLGFFMLTTAVAVTIGITAANIIKPGNGLPESKRNELVEQYRDAAGAKTSKVENDDRNEAEKVIDIIVKMVPTNPINSLSTGDMLAIIFFSIFFGLCLTMIPKEKAEPFIRVMDGLNEVILKMVTLAMETAPYGVFALILGVVATMGIEILLPLLKYGAVVLGALLLHTTITHGSFILFYLRKNPILFLRAIKEAILLGFSTSSSSATLPISMNVTQKNLGVSNEVSSFILPLGATINMDGTALYQGVAAIFIAQVFGVELSMTAQIVMVLTATLASIGAAGVPGAGMITLAVVLSTANIPLEGIALIFGLDRILDMFRTSVNIIGDITCTSVMAKSSGEVLNIQLDQDIIEG